MTMFYAMALPELGWISADQYFSNLRYTTVPAAAAGGLLASARRRR